MRPDLFRRIGLALVLMAVILPGEAASLEGALRVPAVPAAARSPQPGSPAQAAGDQASGDQASGNQASGNPASGAQLSAETKAERAKLDAFKADLDQKEATLKRQHLSDTDLQGLRQGIDPVAEGIRRLIDALGPRLDAAKARLDQLGPKPKEEDQDESPDVARERTERESGFAELDETQRLARTLLVQAEQIVSQISDRRRAAFAKALFERTSGLFSPGLWYSLVRSLPRDGRALGILGHDWLSLIDRQASLGALILVGLAVGVAIALYLGRRFMAPRLVARDPGADPPRRQKLLAATAVLLLGAVPAAAGSVLVYATLEGVNMVPARAEPLVGAILRGLAFVALVRSLADAIFAPDRPSWRLRSLSDAAASRIAVFAVLLSAVVAMAKVLEALNQAIAAALPMTVATRGVFALACALILADLLRRFATTATDEEACLGPYVPTEAEIGGPVRVVGWAAVAAVIASVLVGYIALASFLVDQIAWIGVILALLLLGLALADEFIGGTLAGQTRIATTLQANTGLRRRSLEQIGVLASAVARVVLILAAALLALAPWGIESADLMSSLRAAFFGFKIGDVTISLSAIAVAVLVFAAGFGATRIVQRWLDTTFLPATDLDAGLRNSIRTAFGYFGVVIAGAVAFSYLGLSLDKIAIVAGALSVGIGFGLQSIVNNFVSGLILLWERPIRVGDLVVVGDGEGHVRKISVRATEIETFDRSTIIVPNSNLISGVVRNRVRGDRSGRVSVPVNVLRNADPARAAEILVNCAGRHPEVLREPAPRVVFKKIGDVWLEFDLVCFVVDVDHQLRVLSDLNFAVFKSLTEEKLIPPLGPPALDVKGLGSVEAALEHIACAIGATPTNPAPQDPAAQGPSPQELAPQELAAQDLAPAAKPSRPAPAQASEPSTGE